VDNNVYNVARHIQQHEIGSQPNVFYCMEPDRKIDEMKLNKILLAS